MNEPLNCEEARLLAPELSLGNATGEERARVLNHLASCPDCRRFVSELSAVADELLLLAPAHEPPAGFESRVLARLNDTRRERRSVRGLLALAAAAVIAGAAGASGVLLSLTTDRAIALQYRQALAVADGEYFGAVPLLDSRRQERGLVFGYLGSPSWLFVTLEAPLDRATYRAELLVRRGGPIVLDESVRLSEARPSWGTVLQADFHEATGFQIVDGDGQQVLRAQFPPLEPEGPPPFH
jgi:hypothetical protein